MSKFGNLYPDDVSQISPRVVFTWTPRKEKGLRQRAARWKIIAGSITVASAPDTVAYVTGSIGLTPNNNARITRALH